jgi:hypothetical protein
MRPLFLLMAVLSHSVAVGATVVPNANITLAGVLQFPPAIFTATVAQDMTNFVHFTTTTFELRRIDSQDNQFAIRVSNWAIDEEADWYLVKPGDAFSKAGIAAKKFTPLFTSDNPYPALTVGRDFFLGVNTGISLPDYRESFGWVHFRIGVHIGGEWLSLNMIENAMSYDSPGIIVGTHTVVPEPAALAMVSVALLGLAARRRRN